MKSLNVPSYNVVEISDQEMVAINGGSIELVLAIGAVCAAVVAVYEVGKAVGETIYHATH
jgi:hypothetical protein